VSKYGRRGDIWAVGCTIIQMLTGDPPWKDRKLHSIIQLHVLLSTWVGIPPINREIPDDLRSFLDLCFEKDPKNRPMAETLLQHPFLTDLCVDSSPAFYRLHLTSPPVGMRSELIVSDQRVGLIFVSNWSVLQLGHIIVPMRTLKTFTAPQEDRTGWLLSRQEYLTGLPQSLLDRPHLSLSLSNGMVPKTPYLPPYQSDFASPPPKHQRQSSRDSSSSSGPSPHNPYARRSIATPSPDNPYGRNPRASTNSISPQHVTPGMAPSASENSFLKKPPATAGGAGGVGGVATQQISSAGAVMKVKAWSPSELSDSGDQSHRSNEGDDSLQYSGGSSGRKKGVSHYHPQESDDDVEEEVAEEHYSADNYSDEELETHPLQRIRSQRAGLSQPNGKRNEGGGPVPIYPEIPTKPRKMMAGVGRLDLHPSTSAPTLQPTVSTPPLTRRTRYPPSSSSSSSEQQPSQHQHTKIPPLAPGQHGHGHGTTSENSSARKNLNPRSFVQHSSSDSLEEGAVSDRRQSKASDSKLKSRQPPPSQQQQHSHPPPSIDIPPLSSHHQRLLLRDNTSQLSKSSNHPIFEEKKKKKTADSLHPPHPSSSSSARASSGVGRSSGVGLAKWRCTNRNCVHINYAQDNYCSNCGSMKSTLKKS
jgi:hypothetical protein